MKDVWGRMTNPGVDRRSSNPAGLPGTQTVSIREAETALQSMLAELRKWRRDPARNVGANVSEILENVGLNEESVRRVRIL